MSNPKENIMSLISQSGPKESHDLSRGSMSRLSVRSESVMSGGVHDGTEWWTSHSGGGRAVNDRSKYVKNCVARFRAVVKPEWGDAPWNALAECIEIAAKSGIETAHQQLIALVEALEIRAREESDGEFIATFDRPTAMAMLDEVERLRREVREWMCDGCNTVYPGPPQPGIWCVQCPRCGGDTAPRGVIERRRLEREVERRLQ